VYSPEHTVCHQEAPKGIHSQPSGGQKCVHRHPAALGVPGSVLESMDSPMDKVADHYKPRSCHSQILWNKSTGSRHVPGQVANGTSLQVQHMDTGHSPSHQEKQAIRGTVQTLGFPCSPCRHQDAPKQLGCQE
jgi:hypothetical protein